MKALTAVTAKDSDPKRLMKNISTKFGFEKVILKNKSREVDQKCGLRCFCLPK